jgi:hypothetical protein
MTLKWHFNQRRLSGRMRDSANDAFFTAESLENISDALVREGVQNSIDAAMRDSDGTRQVRININLNRTPSQQAQKFIKTHFLPSKTHFAQGLGAIESELLSHENLSYLTFEDFGTRGLVGKVDECSLSAVNNAFMSFFRAEGRSAKTGGNLGRWGIGKHVFPTSSKLHAIFAVTVRSDDPSKVLMGSAVIKNHTVEGIDYEPDTWFGTRKNEEALVMPIADAKFIHDFEDAFQLKRKQELGLSIVVPAVDERVSFDDLVVGVMSSFFWAILLGELEVNISEGTQKLSLNSETISEQKRRVGADRSETLSLATWAAFAKESTKVTLPSRNSRHPRWSHEGEGKLDEAAIRSINENLQRDGKVAVKVPVWIEPKDQTKPKGESFFTVYLRREKEASHRAQFLRDGILIADVRPSPLPNARALVVVDDALLAGLLGDAEGVNHTQWQKDSPKFHNRYVYGPQVITFVTRSANEILKQIQPPDAKVDPNLLVHIFSIPTDSGVLQPRTQSHANGVPESSETEIDEIPPARKQPFRLEKKRGGFLIRSSESPFSSFPARIVVQAAYAIRNGKALKKWSPDDFTFDSRRLRQEPRASGLVVLKEHANVLELEVRCPTFEIGIVGFDINRDLFVYAKSEITEP